MDFSSAFNTIVPELLHSKFSQLTVPEPLCLWDHQLPDRQEAACEVGKAHLGPTNAQHRSTAGLCTEREREEWEERERGGRVRGGGVG